MQHKRLRTYADGVIISDIDERIVSETLADRISMVGAWVQENWLDADAADKARAYVVHIRDIAAQATSDDDKAACDAIEAVPLPSMEQPG